MSVVAEIQSAIALIRKHSTGGAESIRRFVQNQADGALNSAATGKAKPFQHFSPGTIIDAGGGMEYEFPIAAIDASRYILVLQAELRAIASRLVMPEFMLSSDASNANYSSTMVAEGPAVRMFERMQHQTIADDLRLFRKALQIGIDGGLLPVDTLRKVSIHAIASQGDAAKPMIETIRSQTLALIAEITAQPKPTYTIDGQSVDWAAYLERLQKTVDWCDRQLATDGPVEIISQAR